MLYTHYPSNTVPIRYTTTKTQKPHPSTSILYECAKKNGNICECVPGQANSNLLSWKASQSPTLALKHT